MHPTCTVTCTTAQTEHQALTSTNNFCLMENLIEIIIRLASAMLLGGIIGIEREYRSKDAGFRTHFLVSLGSALFCVVSQYGFGDGQHDYSRVAAQVVSGIGFIGAGTIIFQKNMIKGLTTAAGLWVTAAIGLACGTGMYLAAATTTVLVLLGLEVLNSFLPHLGSTRMQVSFTATTKESVKSAIKRIKNHNIDIHSYELKERRTSKGEIYEANIELRIKYGQKHEDVLSYIEDFDDVTISSME